MSGFQAVNLSEFNRTFEGLEGDFDDALPILETVAERAFYPIMAEIFDTEGRGRWRDLQPGYARRKRERWGDKPIGQASGALIRSLTKKGAAFNVHMSLGRNALFVGSSLAHARHFHKDRPIELTEKDVDRMTEAAADEAKKMAERRGFKTR